MHYFFARVNLVIQIRQREPNHANFVICATCLPSWMRPLRNTCRSSRYATTDSRIAGLAGPTSTPAGWTTFTAAVVHSCLYPKYAAIQCLSTTSLGPHAAVHDSRRGRHGANTRSRSCGHLCTSICRRSPACPPLRQARRRPVTSRVPSLDIPNTRSRNAIQAALQRLYAQHYLVNLTTYLVFYLNALRTS
jgi:hypothetical protein